MKVCANCSHGLHEAPAVESCCCPCHGQLHGPAFAPEPARPEIQDQIRMDWLEANGDWLRCDWLAFRTDQAAWWTTGSEANYKPHTPARRGARGRTRSGHCSERSWTASQAWPALAQNWPQARCNLPGGTTGPPEGLRRRVGQMDAAGGRSCSEAAGT